MTRRGVQLGFAVTLLMANAACDKEPESEVADADPTQTEAFQEPATFMNFEGEIPRLVDEASTELDYEEMLAAGYDVYVVSDATTVSIHAFTTDEKAESWGDPLGYKVSQRHAFEKEVAAYADANGLTSESVEPEHFEFQENAYRKHFGENLNGEVASRGTGLLWRGCNGDNGPLQIVNTKPFISQRRWRNSISSYTGFQVLNRWTFYDRSWYRRSLGSFVSTGLGWWELCGTPANDRTNSIVNI